jgi:hypothetical protein
LHVHWRLDMDKSSQWLLSKPMGGRSKEDQTNKIGLTSSQLVHVEIYWCGRLPAWRKTGESSLYKVLLCSPILPDPPTSTN